MLHGEVIRLLCIRLKSEHTKNNQPIYKTLQSTPCEIEVRKNPDGRYITITTEGVPGRGKLAMALPRTELRAVLQMPYDFRDFNEFFNKVKACIDALYHQAERGEKG